MAFDRLRREARSTVRLRVRVSIPRAVLASASVEIGGLLLLALGAALFCEGLPYFVSPTAVRRYLDWIARMSDAVLRILGLSMMAAGLLLAWVATR